MYYTIEANYWQTRSIAQPPCDRRATCFSKLIKPISPDVGFASVATAADDVRRHVVPRSTDGGHPRDWLQLPGRPEVTEFHVSIDVTQNVSTCRQWIFISSCKVKSKANTAICRVYRRERVSNALPRLVSWRWSPLASPPARHSANTARPRARAGVSRVCLFTPPAIARYSFQPAQRAGSGWVGLVAWSAPKWFTGLKMVTHLGTNRA